MQGRRALGQGADTGEEGRRVRVVNLGKECRAVGGVGGDGKDWDRADGWMD